MKQKENKCDVAVVGAGPAGMMAAIAAAQSGAKVVLFEKNDCAGKKLLLTGGGRCNLTNDEPDLRKLVDNYGKNGPFLFHAFSEFGPGAVREFFAGLGIKTVVEAKLRVFPESGRAQDVLEALLERLKKMDVKIMFQCPVACLEVKNGLVEKMTLVSGGTVNAKNYIIAPGGMSFAATGSSGDGYRWASEIGHKVSGPLPALVPVRTLQEWSKSLSGVSLKSARITALRGGKKVFVRDGECLFTHFGLSGPAILDLSSGIAKLLASGPIDLSIDLFPGIDRGALEKIFLDDFKKYPNRILRNCLGSFVPQMLAAELCPLVPVDAEKTVNNVTKEERRHLVGILKDIRLTVVGLLDVEAGMVTEGGVDLKNIDDKTMRSKIVGNLFFAGEIIDVHGRTGGFNLQQSWATGHLAGESAAASK